MRAEARREGQGHAELHGVEVELQVARERVEGQRVGTEPWSPDGASERERGAERGEMPPVNMAEQSDRRRQECPRLTELFKLLQAD